MESRALSVVTAHRDENVDFDRELLAVERVPHQAAPQPDAFLRPWLDGELDDPATEPRLRESSAAACCWRGEPIIVDVRS